MVESPNYYELIELVKMRSHGKHQNDYICGVGIPVGSFHYITSLNICGGERIVFDSFLIDLCLRFHDVCWCLASRRSDRALLLGDTASVAPSVFSDRQGHRGGRRRQCGGGGGANDHDITAARPDGSGVAGVPLGVASEG